MARAGPWRADACPAASKGSPMLLELLATKESIRSYCYKIANCKHDDPVRDVQTIWDWIQRHAPYALNDLPALMPVDRTPNGALAKIQKGFLADVTQLPSSAFTAEVIAALIAANYDFGAPLSHYDSTYYSFDWTKEVWMHQIKRGRVIRLALVPENVWDADIQSMCDQLNLIDCNNVENLPTKIQTREMWEKFVLKEKQEREEKHLDSTRYVRELKCRLPPKFCDPPMFAFLQQHGLAREGDIDFINVTFQTREMWEDVIRRQIMECSKTAIPSAFMDAAMRKLLLHNGYCRLSGISYAERCDAFSQSLFDAYVKKREWNEIALFPSTYFNQQSYNDFFAKGMHLSDIPMNYRTSDMYLHWVQTKRFTWFTNIPSQFLNAEIWEELVQVNVENVRNVPPELLSARMIDTAVARHKSNYLPKESRPKPAKAIAKRRKRKDWQRR